MLQTKRTADSSTQRKNDATSVKSTTAPMVERVAQAGAFDQVPAEIWGTIFGIVLDNAPFENLPRNLKAFNTLRHVCSAWRSAALFHGGAL